MDDSGGGRPYGATMDPHRLRGLLPAATGRPGSRSLPLVDRSAPESAALLVCYTAALLAGAAVTFRRRDVA